MNKKDIQLLAEAYGMDDNIPTQFEDIKVRRLRSYINNQIENLKKVNESIDTLEAEGRYDIRIEELIETLSYELQRLGIYDDLKDELK